MPLIHDLRKFFSTPLKKIFQRLSTVLVLIGSLLLTLSNVVLSYGTLAPVPKIWVILFGFIAPLAAAFFLLKKQDPLAVETISTIPSSISVILFFFASFLRLFPPTPP